MNELQYLLTKLIKTNYSFLMMLHDFKHISLVQNVILYTLCYFDSKHRLGNFMLVNIKMK